MKRKTFLKSASMAGSSIALMGIGFAASPKPYTVQQIIDLIIKEIPNAPFSNTVDTLKSGSPQQPVTGIISTMFATVPMIREAIRRKVNFIIVHEPSFYNHTDDSHWVEKNEVLEMKMKLINENKIAIWRFHDYWHAHRPDGIMEGLKKQLGWMNYQKLNEPIFTIPPIKIQELITHVKSSLGVSTIKLIGDLNASAQRILLLPGASGGQSHLRSVEKWQPDVLMVGELHEWETGEYIRDARALGKNISLLVLGHALSEEPGMKWLADWLQPKLNGITVTHIPTPDPFRFV